MSTTSDDLAEIIQKAEARLYNAMKLLDKGKRQRDRFEAACAAMQGLLASMAEDEKVVNIAALAQSAVSFADALLAALDKEPGAE